MINTNKIKKWVQESLEVVNTTGNTEDLHIDCLTDFSVWKMTKPEVFKIAINVFEEMVLVAKNYTFGDLQLILQIELTKSSSKIKGVSKNEIDLINSIDNQFSIPEIILYKPTSNQIITENEFYRSVLPFKVTNNQNIKVFYKEFRSHSELESNEKFNRNLDLVYVPN